MSTVDSSHSKPSGFLTLVWALFFFLIFALIVVIWIRGHGPTEIVEDKRAEARIAKRLELQKSDSAKLLRPGWVDKAKGIVHIPISNAKALLVAELKANPRNPVASAVKVEPSLPAPAPFDPKAAEPAPPALPSAPQGADTIHFEKPAPAAAPSALIQTPASAQTDSLTSQSGSLINSIATSEINQ